jgi:hypothetical protein
LNKKVPKNTIGATIKIDTRPLEEKDILYSVLHFSQIIGLYPNHNDLLITPHFICRPHLLHLGKLISYTPLLSFKVQKKNLLTYYFSNHPLLEEEKNIIVTPVTR